MRSQFKDRNITIGTLVLNVLTPLLESHRIFKSVGAVGQDQVTSDGRLTIIRPETFVRIILRYLDSMYLRRFDLPQVLTVLHSVKKVYLLHDSDEKGFWNLQSTPVLNDSDSEED